MKCYGVWIQPKDDVGFWEMHKGCIFWTISKEAAEYQTRVSQERWSFGVVTVKEFDEEK